MWCELEAAFLRCTLPDTLWPLFFHNRHLLEAVCRLAVDNLLYAARQRGLSIGVFCAIHTYGRRLNWHPHVHVSVTCGGINENGEWKGLSYNKSALRQRWMWNLRQFLISQWQHITLPSELEWIASQSAFKSLVLQAGGLHWHIYVSKKTANGRKTVNYLGRYLKKPPISGSRLAHYSASPTVSFNYLDHRTKTYQRETVSQAEMLRRVIQHIPEKHFRMIRYFGFLANRVCGQQLPRVYEALQMAAPEKAKKLYFAQMSKAFLNRDPFSCVLCGGRLVYSRALSGLRVAQLMAKARDIGLLRYVSP